MNNPNKQTQGVKHIFPIKIEDMSYLFDSKLLQFLKEQKCEYLDDIANILSRTTVEPLPNMPNLIYRRLELMSALIKTNYDMFSNYYLDDHITPITLTYFKRLPNSESFNVLQEILPNSVFKTFRAEGIITLSQLAGMTQSVFEDIRERSPECYETIGDIISMLTNSPKSISRNIAVNYCNKYGIPNLSIQPLYALGHIPNILYNKLIALEVNDVMGLLALNLNVFSQQPYIGVSVVQDLIALCNGLVDNNELASRVIGSFVPEGTIGVKIPQENLFELICKTIVQYYDKSGSSREKEIILRRNRLWGNKYYTLDEIALTYDLTRERIRQIELSEYKHLNAFILGDCENETKVFINPELSKLARTLLETLSTSRFWYKQEISENMLVGGGQLHSEWLDFIMRIIGYENVTITDETIYYNCKILPVEMRDAIEFILHILQMHPNGLSVTDTKFEMRRARKLSFTEREIEYLALGLSDVERFSVAGQDLLRIRLTALNKTEFLAFRILYEHGEPLHFNEITSRVNASIKAGSSRERIRNVTTIKSSMMRNHELFAPIGKSGLWALVSWDLEIRPIFEILQEALMESGTPMCVDALYQIVLSKRKQISRQTIHSILSIYDDLFRRVDESIYELTTD